MIAFALSCVGLLMFLWLSFGGSLPLAPQSYRFTVEFSQAVNLGNQADVEIAGVPIGKVVSVGLDRRTGLNRAVIEIESRYAPRPANTRAILRQKTLLGETFVQLTLGNEKGRMLPDGGTLPQAQVSPTVQLDQILSTFDPATRHAFESWIEQEGIALTGRGQAFNAAFAELFPFATNVDSVLAVLNRDSAATSTLLSDGALVLDAVRRPRRSYRGSSATPIACSRRPRPATPSSRRRSARCPRSSTRPGRRSRGCTRSRRRRRRWCRSCVRRRSSSARRSRPSPDWLRSCETLLAEIGPLTAASREGFRRSCASCSSRSRCSGA